MLYFAVLMVCMWCSAVWAHSLAEIAGAPAAFAQQTVRVRGVVDDVVTRYGETPYTILALSDEEETVLSVFAWGIPPCKLGDVCQVTGTVVTQKVIDTHHLGLAVEADTVEQVAEAEYKKAGPVFAKKKKMGNTRVGKYLQGFSLFP
ncbi:MAG: hypothetical protein NZ578_03170 [Candidatus Binatia bacterium]|nr:hypothetical protein [Candidatus Binatia bacterium]